MRSDNSGLTGHRATARVALLAGGRIVKDRDGYRVAPTDGPLLLWLNYGPCNHVRRTSVEPDAGREAKEINSVPVGDY